MLLFTFLHNTLLVQTCIVHCDCAHVSPPYSSPRSSSSRPCHRTTNRRPIAAAAAGHGYPAPCEPPPVGQLPVDRTRSPCRALLRQPQFWHMHVAVSLRLRGCPIPHHGNPAAPLERAPLRACLANTSAQGLDELLSLDKRSSRRYTVPTTRGDGASEIAGDSSTSEEIEAGNALSSELTGLLRHPARSSYRGGKPAGSSVWI
jgi:hypothetical protein